jgi:hypothetical protein
MREFVQLNVSTYRGAIGAEHYYGRFSVQIKEERVEKPDGTTSWVIRSGYGSERHPLDRTDVERKIGAREAAYLNKKDSTDAYCRIKAGDMVTRFNDRETVIEAAKAAFPTLFDDTDILVYEEHRYSGDYVVLAGPPEIVEFLNSHTGYADRHRYLYDNGYLRKGE